MNDLAKPSLLNGPLIGLRLLLIVVGLGLWFWSQEAIGTRDNHFDDSVAQGMLQGDGLLQMSASINAYLGEQHQVADYLLILSSLLINVLALFLLGSALFGKTMRPFLGLLVLFALRQLCQVISALPAPPDMIWRQPAFPAWLGGWEPPGLLVTYGVSNDFFFSGHTAIAVFGAVELARQGGRFLIAAGLASALFQMTVVLLLRAHWTIDVFAGTLAALLVALLAGSIAAPVDRLFARWSGSAVE